MSSQQTEAVTALRAALTKTLAIIRGTDVENAVVDVSRMDYSLRDFIADTLAASPPEGAPAVDGGDAVRDLDLIWHSVSDDKETNAAYERLRTRLAAAPAPAVEWEAVGDDLRDRCREVLAWQKTGILPGHALRQLATTLDDSDGYSLQRAEAQTAREAMRALAQPQATPREHPAAQGDDPWTPSGSDYDRAIHANPDANAWADLFVQTFPGLADKHDLMRGWFANAMMAMHDHLRGGGPVNGDHAQFLIDSAAAQGDAGTVREVTDAYLCAGCGEGIGDFPHDDWECPRCGCITMERNRRAHPQGEHKEGAE